MWYFNISAQLQGDGQRKTEHKFMKKDLYEQEANLKDLHSKYGKIEYLAIDSMTYYTWRNDNNQKSSFEVICPFCEAT